MSTESRELPELLAEWRERANTLRQQCLSLSNPTTLHREAAAIDEYADQLEAALAHSRAQDSGGEAAMEGWHSAVDDASELFTNAPDERYASRASRVVTWIKANRPAAEQVAGGGGVEAADGFRQACDAFGIGEQARTVSCLLTNIQNAKRFAEYLQAIEREFFMVPGEQDDDYPDDPPEDECLLNSWGSTKEEYIEQFRSALTALSTRDDGARVSDAMVKRAASAYVENGLGGKMCSHSAMRDALEAAQAAPQQDDTP